VSERVVQRAAEFGGDDSALVIRQRDGRLDGQLFHQLAMFDGALGPACIAHYFAGGEAGRFEMQA
jgi:hypothetical protein